MQDEPTLKQLSDAANRATDAGHWREVQTAMICAGWIPTNTPAGWSRCREEWPGDRQSVIDKCEALMNSDGTP
jgi:hypothetical protein